MPKHGKLSDRMSRRGEQKAQGGDKSKRHTPVTLAKREGDAATSAPEKKKQKGSSDSDDVVYVHSPCESGEGYNIIRQRSDRLEVGELRTLKEGKPVVGELVKLTPRTGAFHGPLHPVSVCASHCSSEIRAAARWTALRIRG